MNSQATLQKMTDTIHLNVANVRCYVDDVIIFSKNTKEHASHLENVFDILKNNGFRQPSLELLGHVLDKNGVDFNEQKVEKVRDAIPPTSRKNFGHF